MTARTVSARDLETMAHAAHERVELPGPEGGWAVAVINGHLYRARVAPAAEITDMREPGEAFCADCPDHEACLQAAPCSLVKRVNDPAYVAATPEETP